MEKKSISHKIIGNLRMCGHFLHYKMGGKVGRRRISAVLLEHGEIAQRELQDILQVRSASLSEILAKAEADGMIKKRKSEADGRQLMIRLTDAGREQALYMQSVYLRRVEQMMDCFSEDEKQTFLEMLERLNEHWAYLELSEGPPPIPKPRIKKGRI